MRRLTAVLFALFALVALLLPAQPAFAHAALLESTPVDGVLLQVAPGAVVLRFSERVGTSLGAVRVVAPDGNRADTGRVETRAGGKEVVAPLRDGLAPGTYLLLWRVVSEDSHPVSGASTFSVGRESAVAAAVPEQNAGGTAGALLTVSRGVLYAGLVLLVGGVAFVMVVWRAGQQVRAVRRVLWSGWGLAVTGSAAGLLLQGPYAAGLPLSDAPSLVDDVLGTRFGMATGTRLALLALAGVLLVRRLSWSTALPVGAGLLVTTSLVGHAGAGQYVPVALPADALHLGAVSAWLGGLALLALVVLRRGEILAEVLPRWSRWAAGSVVVLVATGTFASWREVRELGALTGTTYGRLLLVKTALVAGMLVLGALGRAWVRRHYALPVVHANADLPEPVRTVPDARRLRRSVLLEAGTAVVVLAVTAALVETTPARSAYAPLISETKVVAGDLRVQVDLEPARAGLNQMHVYYTGAGGKAVDVEEVTARFTRVGTDEVVPVDVPPDSLGHYEQLKVPLPDPGQWRLLLTTRTSDVDAPATSFTFRIR
ncbi:MAG: copper resistance protein CopC [Mycobacteriales bacterium]